MTDSAKTLTIRLPHDLYETACVVARRRELSLNALVRTALEAIARDEEEAKLYEAFGSLGEHVEEAEIDFAFPAQREVVIGGESRRSKSRRKSRPR